jgi:hypothetical protein
MGSRIETAHKYETAFERFRSSSGADKSAMLGLVQEALAREQELGARISHLESSAAALEATSADAAALAERANRAVAAAATQLSCALRLNEGLRAQLAAVRSERNRVAAESEGLRLEALTATMALRFHRQASAAGPAN